MKKLYVSSFVYAILGLFAGVFYREFTKATGFTGETVLSVLHTHILSLGLLFGLIALLLTARFKLEQFRTFLGFFISYQIALVLFLGSLITRGVVQVLIESPSSALSASIAGVSGIGHLLLSVALVTFMILVGKGIKSDSN